MGSIRFFVLGLVLLSANVYVSEAVEFSVGGKESSWRIPTSPNELNAWAEKERFKIGDVLVFKYDSKTDSVLQVEEGDYKKCNKTKPIKSYNDGNTKININESGAFYFISGANEHCEKGEKLEVKVLSHKHSNPFAPTQAPKVAPTRSPKASPVIISTTPAESPKTSYSGRLNVGVSIIVMATFGVAIV